MSLTNPIVIALLLVACGAGLVIAGLFIIYYATCAMRSQWLGPSDWHGRTNTSAVALTFDDGPSADTERILEVLDRYDAKATFFMLGRQVERFPQIARRVLAEGHGVGNHSYSHPSFIFTRASETRSQMERGHEAITNVLGVPPTLARPPYGARTPAYFDVTRKLRLRTVLWSLSAFDWSQKDHVKIARRVLRKVKPGTIIVLHDADNTGRCDRTPTVNALSLILEGLRARGLKIAPLSQILEPDPSQDSLTV
jgi:peptidoglycan/xylan/chitin deacetylase (PgdA/CDA1 family)